MTDPAIERVERAIEAIRNGGMVILVDDEDRENEGDLCLAAEMVTPAHINFMAKEGRGLICLSLRPERVEQLGLDMMTGRNTSRFGTAFTVSIEARRGVSTGISAADRATTIRTAIAPEAGPEDIVTPGHVFPLRAQPGGVLARTGQTEGSVDLARLAGLEPAGVICEIMKDDGTMARMADLEQFAQKHDLLIVSVADIVHYRLQTERLVDEVAHGPYLPGVEDIDSRFEAHVYRSKVDRSEFMALVLGEWREDEPVLVRVHSACIGDAFNSRQCDCGQLLRRSLAMIQEEGKGVFLYILPNRVRLADQFRAHVLHEDERPEDALDPSDPDFKTPVRGFGLGAQVLMDLGVRRIRLLTNNPKKLVGLAGFGLEVTTRVPVPVPRTPDNETYLERKRRRGEHEDSAAKEVVVQAREGREVLS